MHFSIFPGNSAGLGPQARSDRNFGTLDWFVPSDSQVRADILTSTVAWLWFILFWFKWESLSLVLQRVLSLSVLLQSWHLQHPSTTQTHFFWALERRAALSAFYRQGVEEQRDCRIYLRPLRRLQSTKLVTSQITDHCLPLQDQGSFSAVAFPRMLSEHTHAVLCLNGFITGMNSETPYCWVFYHMD